MMQHSMISLFHAQSYQDAWMDYNRSLTNPAFPRWDFVILTASNEQQAAGFRAQLRQREEAGFLPPQTHFAAIPDPDGKRVGSGGATLGVIHYIAQQLGSTDFSGLRILVIHSGGDSKRVPQYSALGKLFSPVPRMLPNGRSSTLFDEFMIAMGSVPSRIREGMLLLSGDVLLLFNPLLIDYSGEGAAAISFKEHMEIGKNHGVYLCGKDGYVAKCLQKQTVETLRAAGAVNEMDCVDIDTGAVIFSSSMLCALYSLVCADGVFSEEKFHQYVNDTVRLSLYADFLYPLGTDATLEAFYREKPEGEYSDALMSARTAVWEKLSPYKMKLLRLSPSKFIHFGTTGEIMRLMNSDIDQFSYLGWNRSVNSSIAKKGVAGYNSFLSSDAACGENIYLEVSYVHSKAVIGSNVLLSYVDIHDENIPDNVVLHGLKQKDGRFVVRIYGVDDNPKGLEESGCSFLGMTLATFMQENGIAAHELWREDEHSLWFAKMYPVCNNVKDGIAAALNIYAMSRGGGNVDAWRQAQRMSLHSGFNNADPDALIAWDMRMRELVAMGDVVQEIRAGKPVAEMRKLPGGALTPIQQQWLRDRLKQADFSEAMRLHYYIGQMLEGVEREKHIAACFRTIQRAVLANSVNHLKENTVCRIVVDQHKVSLPLRVNWGGGWSDTPPYCIEHGGTVLNAAILVDGKMPVEVTLTRLDEKKIVFDCRDMDSHGEFADIAPLQMTGDPYDPFALQKAALLACGIIPMEGSSLDEVLTRLGGGFLMQTEVTGVPKGSGLGTSSILAAACVKALFEFMGIPHTEDDLCSHVLVMEQIMSTGGGWQDQVGGLSNGVKYITTMPGLQQKINIQHLNIPQPARKELSDRFVLIYTGQRRLARNLLRDVVGHYIGNEPKSLHALNEIQRVAALMRFELERGHISDFAKLMSEHWELSKMIDAGSSNTLIDQIFTVVENLLDGRMICGAGGGGFLQGILKEGVGKEDVHARLKEVFQDSDIGVWNCQLI